MTEDGGGVPVEPKPAPPTACAAHGFGSTGNAASAGGSPLGTTPAFEAASSGRSESGESARKKQRQESQDKQQTTWVRFAFTVPSTAMTVDELKAGLRLGRTMSTTVAIALPPPSTPALKRQRKDKVNKAEEAVKCVQECVAPFVAGRHTVLVRPGGAQGGRKTMAEIWNLINPIVPGPDHCPHQAEISPIPFKENGKDTALYTNTKSLFLGHFQALGNEDNLFVDAEGWSIICAEGVKFHYKGTPAGWVDETPGTPAKHKDGAEETPGFILIIEDRLEPQPTGGLLWHHQQVRVFQPLPGRKGCSHCVAKAQTAVCAFCD